MSERPRTRKVSEAHFPVAMTDTTALELVRVLLDTDLDWDLGLMQVVASTVRSTGRVVRAHADTGEVA